MRCYIANKFSLLKRMLSEVKVDCYGSEKAGKEATNGGLVSVSIPLKCCIQFFHSLKMKMALMRLSAK